MANTSIQIRDAHWGDLPEIAHLLSLAYWDNNLMAERLHPHRHEYPADFDQYWLRQLRNFFWDWRSKFLVAVEVQEEEAAGRKGKRARRKELRIAGYAHWERKGDDEAARKMDLWRMDPRAFFFFSLFAPLLNFIFPLPNPHSLIHISPGNLLRPLTKSLMTLHAHLYPNRAADLDWLTAPDKSYSYFVPKYWSGPRASSWFLECLGVSPDFQGQKVGQRLVRWGLDQAENEVPNSVCASVIVALGKDGFYQKWV